uniref:Uncharacterized protein n=1 Tax=Parascaris equorum TaxID=6256 RepID=A0A914RG81_PAREQ
MRENASEKRRDELEESTVAAVMAQKRNQNDQLNNRVAKVVEATDEQLLEEGRRNPEALRRFAFYNNEHWRRLYENWPWIRIPDVSEETTGVFYGVHHLVQSADIKQNY